MAKRKKSQEAGMVGKIKQKNETPEQRFTRLATARVSVAIKRLRLIRNLAGSSYKSTEEQRDKIFSALNQEMDALRSAFSEKFSTGAVMFQL